MLEPNILQQVTEIFRNLEADYTFRISYAPQREESVLLIEFLNDFASTSTRLSVEKHEAEGDALAFDLLKNGEDTGITFHFQMRRGTCKVVQERYQLATFLTLSSIANAECIVGFQITEDFIYLLEDVRFEHSCDVLFFIR